MDFSHLAFEFQWEQCFSMIDKWKATMIDHIINIHQEKTLEIQVYKDQAERDVSLERTNFILNMNEYFQNSCILSNEIDSFKKKLNQLKENILRRPLPLNIDIGSCSLNKLICIQPVFNQELFHHKNIFAEYKIDTRSVYLMATSNNQIIIVNNKLTVFLYDKLIGYIGEITLSDYTNEVLNDIRWSIDYKNFLFLCDYSLWSLEKLFLKKLAHIPNKKYILNNLTCFHNYFFLTYNQGEYIDRWIIQPEWKLDKRWVKYHRNDILISISSNSNYLLFYTNKTIQLCSDDLIIQYSIDLLQQEHFYTHFMFLSLYQIWLFVDKETRLLKYFDVNNRTIQTLDQIFVQTISSMGSNELAIVSNDYYLQIISI